MKNSKPEFSKAAAGVRRLYFCFLLHLLSACSFQLSAFAQSYSLDWSTIDGSGSSTGSVFTVSGTIGQPDASTMSGGSCTLQGGFWGLIAAVQTPGARLLSISIHHHRLLARAVVIPAEHGFSGALSKQANL